MMKVHEMKVREHAKELKIPKEEMQSVEAVLKSTTDEQVKAAVASLRSGGLREIPPLAESWFEALRDEYEALPYLRRSTNAV